MLFRIATVVVFIGTICVIWLLLFGWPSSKSNLMGCTPAEVRKQCGEPWRIEDARNLVAGLDEYSWYYRRGLLGMYVVTFKKDAVTEVHSGSVGH